MGISRRLQDRLQSVPNAAARLVCNGQKYDHITPLLRDLHWHRRTLCSVWPFRCRNSTAPEYPARDLQWAVDDDSRKRLRSTSSHKLVVRRSRLKTVGDRVFGMAASQVWNGLPSDVTSAQSSSTFKTHLFRLFRHLLNSICIL